MLEIKEIVFLVVAFAVAPLLFFGAKPLTRRTWSLMVMAYLLMMAGYTVSIVEGFILPDPLNVIEHALYASGAVVFMIFAARTYGEARGARR